MKKIVLLGLGLLFAFLIKAQDDADTAWRVNGDVSLMFSQAAFSNWAPGGDNNINLSGYLNYYAGYLKGKHKWETLLALAYGQSKIGDQDFRKNEDKIDLLSNYGYAASDKWYYSANFNFKSQFAEGFNFNDDVDTLGPEKISNFMAPAFITLGVGMEYRPKDYFSAYISPATARWIVVTDQDLANTGAFGVDPAEFDAMGNMIAEGKNLRFEFGAYLRFLFVKDIMKNVNLNTKLELFSNYLNKPENVDVNWDTQIGLKVNDWISAMLAFQLVYDDNTNITDNDGNTGPRTQIREAFSVGLSYKFNSRDE